MNELPDTCDYCSNKENFAFEPLSRTDSAAFNILMDLYDEFDKAVRDGDYVRWQRIRRAMEFVEDQFPLAYERISKFKGE